ncbi:MAG: tRNA (adenosine(37)-N6)-threonylcarbamoyltransferase complex transferase subunit TsaD [Endomicrobiia bacterium]|nr:tRNA (adenosine(37)-N6)-threonylcarbamoyltransferase complex transferase subunit TsaD [Endomicrobiaceae bacterium]MDD3053566.1 tRNA (adenosine(37)-N6)-threonylcarbamoyltransferase complex transferase subunit TsaD [Endomicrobiaceae bacterium]MDD3922393.1 tRNA (adenosine(37)-N6)-threonylcarbamoyltransferase complex transferase subunit TsaD [Endomicrobiaceae bacterium]
MKILAIETSCDETSASVIENGKKVLSNIISSQIPIHAKYNGVVPELASRAHIQNVNIVIESALKQANIDFDNFANNIDYICCTYGPGLAGSLLVGIMAAKTLSYIYNKPLIPINHIEGHMFSSAIENKTLKPPFLSVVISGGHTELVIVKDYGKYVFLGGTRDDACGEAFDKVAKILGLSYPGGPIIDKLAEFGNPKAINFTRPLLKGSWDFSFSGIKTAVLNYSKKVDIKDQKVVNDICAGFRQAVAETLVYKSFEAVKKYSLESIALGGGVSCNSLIRKMFKDYSKKNNIKIFMPSPVFCTDNATMIAMVAYYKILNKSYNRTNNQINPKPSLGLENW